MKEKNKPSAPHREHEKNFVRRAKIAIRRRNYMSAIQELTWALKQQTAGDVKDAWWEEKGEKICTPTTNRF